MEIQTVTVGPLEENCYLAWLPEEKHLYVIDPGAEADRILEAARRYPFESAAVLLTHAHIDHISAVGAVARALNAPVVMNPADLPLYQSPANAIPPWLPAASGLPKPVGSMATADFEMIPLPGHTPGGAGYYFPAGPVLFAGDTIFENSVGRTDLPGGDAGQLLQSIKTGILSRPDSLTLCCGHGPNTTVGAERRSNPYIQE